ncbi:MAG: head maturation protease, ClpP-related [Cetobacterium sp.]
MPIKKNQNWWEISNKSNGTGEIKIFGNISRYVWDGTGDVNLKKFDEELQKIKNCKKIQLRINSNGGSVFEAVGMYNSLKRVAEENKIELTTYIEGIAASAASFLALVSDKVIMGTGCRFMIHNPSTFGMGESKNLRKTADELDQIKEDILDIYMTRAKITREKVSSYMDEETSFSVKQAIEAGFVDEESSLDRKTLKNNISNTWEDDVIQNFYPEFYEEIENEKKAKITEGELNMTLKDLKNQYPDLVNEVRTEITNELQEANNKKIEEAVTNERSRIKALDEVKTINDVQKQIIVKAKYEEPRNALEISAEFYNSDAWKAEDYITKTKDEGKEAGIDNLGENSTDITNAFDTAVDNIFKGDEE